MRGRGGNSGGIAPGEAISPQALSALIGSIYDCALDPERWDQALAEIIEALDYYTAVIGLVDQRRNTHVFTKRAGIRPEWNEEFERHVPEITARSAAWLSGAASLDEPLVIARDFSTEELAASPYYQKGLRPIGMIDVIQFVLIAQPARLSLLGLGRHERQGVVTERDVETAKLLLPHIRRAVTISNVLDARTIERERMADALDALRCGVMLVDAGGRILHANRAAEETLRRRELIARGRKDVLGATEPPADRELRAAIRLAAGNEAGIGRTGLAIRLTGPETAPVFAHVLPLTGSELRTRLQPQAAAAVFVGTPPEERDAAALLAAIYDLTPAEMRVVAGLVAGHSLAATAAALGTARATAKSHLARVFAKTGTSRQGELLRLAMRISPPAGVEAG